MALIAYGLARLGRDAEVRYLTDGTPVCNLSLAFVCGRKGPDGKRPSQWIDGSLWGKQAEAMAPYLLKGGSISVSLEDVHIEAFTKGDGTPMSKLAGRVLSIEFAGDPPEREQAPAPAPAARAPTRAPAPAPRQAAAPPPRSHGFDNMDDDIPF
jgi:single-strand DNA-binding protein